MQDTIKKITPLQAITLAIALISLGLNILLIVKLRQTQQLVAQTLKQAGQDVTGAVRGIGPVNGGDRCCPIVFHDTGLQVAGRRRQ